MPEKVLQEEFSELFIKILFPAFLTVAVGVAIEMKNDKSKVSTLNAFLSFIIGIFGAYLFSGIIFENFTGGAVTLAVSAVTLLAEKIAKFVMYKLNIDVFLTAIVEAAYEWLSKFLPKKQQ